MGGAWTREGCRGRTSLRFHSSGVEGDLPSQRGERAACLLPGDGTRRLDGGRSQGSVPSQSVGHTDAAFVPLLPGGSLPAFRLPRAPGTRGAVNPTVIVSLGYIWRSEKTWQM